MMTEALQVLDFKPDFLWSKERSSTSGHIIVDSTSGATQNLVQSDNDTAEDTCRYYSSI